MPVEFIGMMAPQESSEIVAAAGPVVDPAVTRRFAQAHEDSGFDRVLIGYFSTMPDGFAVASYVLAHTERLGVLLAHRPGFVAPTVAARAPGHRRPVRRRPPGRPHHHGRRRRRAGARRRPPRRGDALPAPRRVRRPAAAHVDRHRAVRPRGRVLQGAQGVLGGQVRAGAAHPGVLRRLVGRRARHLGPSRRRVRHVGRAARRDGGPHRPGAGAAAAHGRNAAHQPVAAADPGRHRRRGVGSRVRHPGGDPEACRRQGAAAARERGLAAAARRCRAWRGARPLPVHAARHGQRAPGGTRRRWSARWRPWRRR